MNATPVNQNQRELVRILYLQHGHQKASELSGVEYDTVRQWAHRYDWNNRSVTNVTKTIADNVAATLAARKQESRDKISEYQVRAAGVASVHPNPLSITRQVNDLASIHAKVWPEDQTKEVSFSLNVLNMNMLAEGE